MSGTATLAAAFAYEEAQVGYVEQGGPDGRSGNIVKYWPEIGRPDLQGKSWCGAAQDDMARHIGLHMPGSMISTHLGAKAFYDAKQWVPVGKPMLPGDFVFYAWNGSKDLDAIDHIGWGWKMVTRFNLEDFEANTSGTGSSGQAQRNGGMFAKRYRDVEFVVGYGRPHYDKAGPVVVMSSNPYNFHDHLILASQWALAVPLTNKWDKKTVAELIAFKKKNGYPADAGVGPKTQHLLAMVRHHRMITS